MHIIFKKIDSNTSILALESAWRNSLTFPNEDYYESLFDASQHWEIKLVEKLIGFAYVSARNTLFNFYLTSEYLIHGTAILEDFLKQEEIKKAMIGTNNPICFSLVLHFQKSLEIDGYLFKDMVEVFREEKDGQCRIAEPDELESLVNFQIKALESSDERKNWFRDYIGKWISRGEFFVMEHSNEIIGTLEIRTSDLNPKVASLGMIVSEKFRNHGYGTYLLAKGKSIAKARNIEAICACDKENIASLKAIERSGFRKLHSILYITL